MIAMLKRIRKYGLILALPYLFLIFLLTYRIDYSLLAPGGLNVVETQIEFTNVSGVSEGTLHSIYIVEARRPTFFQWMVAYFDDTIDSRALTVAELQDDDRTYWASQQAYKNSSWNAAIIVASKAADYTIDYETHLLVTRVFEYLVHPGIKPLDRIVSVNGSDDSVEALLAAIGEAACEEFHQFSVITTDDEPIDYEIKRQMIDNACVFGLSMQLYYHIIESELQYQIREGFIGGPSGGFVQFLHIYNTITDEDITRGLKIAGTGGIDLEGTITPVGGLKQKVIAAHYAGVDILFVPLGANYTVAINTLATLDTNLKIIGIGHFNDAVDYLEGLADE